MSLPTFGQLLAEYMSRSGISDSELARSIGVRRQTIFRWKEGLVERPRAREDVLQCARKLRLTDEERDRLLLAAGFPPEHLSPTVLQPPPTIQTLPLTEEPSPPLVPVIEPEVAVDAANEQTDLAETEVQGEAVRMVSSALFANTMASHAPVDDPTLDQPLMPGSSPLTPLSKPVDEPIAEAIAVLPLTDAPAQLSASPQPPLLADRQRWLLSAGVLLLALLAFLWARNGPFVTVPTPTPPLTPVITLYPPPQTTPTQIQSMQLAAEGETLLLIAQFKGYTRDNTYNVAGRISEELNDQITAVGLVSTTVTTWAQEITDTRSARDLLAAADATMVIWGEYDSGRVRVNLEVDDAKLSQRQNFTLTSSSELSAIVNETAPKWLRDTALFVLGNQATYRGKYEIAIARKLSELGNVQAAAALFQQALTREQTDATTTAKLNFYLGYVTAKGETLNDYERAIAYYTAAFALSRDYNALYNRGTIQIKRAQKAPANEAFIVGSLDNAITDLTAFIKLRPEDPNGYFNRGVAYYERDVDNDIAAALADFDQVIAMSDDHALAYFHRGLAHIRAGQGEQWVADFQQMLLFDPNDSRPISGLCWGYVMAQQPTKALPYCDQAVQHDASGFSHDSRGIAHAQLGHYPEAIADFRVYLDSLKAQGSMPFFQRNRGPLVETWITDLEADRNPFDDALLEKLRHRDHYEK